MQYGRLKDLSACKTIYEDDFICQDAITYMVNQHPVCEILLKVQQWDHIPSDCQTKTVKSNVQIWMNCVTPSTNYKNSKRLYKGIWKIRSL
ncbi:hypothetical protein Zmor_009577 [Zophobas morio]|uniref:Uncharacterized protein n=1 Tax=Zophobas morio TaxID=2755281 RepID=A0AA38IJ88_9CUCU|nr:hypothetical protein Zmor_009577 [Zophobas morio]